MSAIIQPCTSVLTPAQTLLRDTTAPAETVTDSCQMARPAKTSMNAKRRRKYAVKFARMP